MKTAVYGIGNILLGDDGIGPAVVHYLESRLNTGDHLTLEDLGTPSLDLPNYLDGYDRVIFVDAVNVDAPPGSVRLFTRAEIMAVSPGIRVSPHEPSINDALIVMDFAGNAPAEVTLVGIVPQTLEGAMTLSDAVSRAIPAAADAVMGELGRARVAVN
ncbi:MAG TPA: hydrogenase maturation protease [Thermoanaerobaculia bacterium]